MQPLHDQSPTARFADRAGDYVRYRPSYPDAAIEAVLAGLGRASRLVAADIGAGTGISSRLLGERGVRVLAIEPNSAMRECAQHSERVTFRDGTAEATGLTDESVDLVLCAQAFHWFRPDDALTEFARILKPGGRVALMWNNRDDADPATAEYGRLILEASGRHEAAQRFNHHRPLAECPLFTNFREAVVPSSQSLDAQGLVGRARSASYVPRDGPAWDRLQAGLQALAVRHAAPGGGVTLRYQTHVFLAERG